MLCENCIHMKPIVSGKGAVFVQCRKHFEDASYPKYPRVPVLQCAGFSTTEPPAP
jgi:hypothetical protein